jgi:hypothetical protein
MRNSIMIRRKALKWKDNTIEWGDTIKKEARDYTKKTI